MTTFEITIIVLLTAIVVLLIVLLRTSIEGFHGVWQKFDANCETLSNFYAINAVMCTDALIEELKRGGQND